MAHIEKLGDTEWMNKGDFAGPIKHYLGIEVKFTTNNN